MGSSCWLLRHVPQVTLLAPTNDALTHALMVQLGVAASNGTRSPAQLPLVERLLRYHLVPAVLLLAELPVDSSFAYTHGAGGVRAQRGWLWRHAPRHGLDAREGPGLNGLRVTCGSTFTYSCILLLAIPGPIVLCPIASPPACSTRPSLSNCCALPLPLSCIPPSPRPACRYHLHSKGRRRHLRAGRAQHRACGARRHPRRARHAAAGRRRAAAAPAAAQHRGPLPCGHVHPIPIPFHHAAASRS